MFWASRADFSAACWIRCSTERSAVSWTPSIAAELACLVAPLFRVRFLSPLSPNCWFANCDYTSIASVAWKLNDSPLPLPPIRQPPLRQRLQHHSLGLNTASHGVSSAEIGDLIRANW
ncbi:proline synthase co-transcribed bacterial-like protein [Pyrus ussuriensis x Pyrus communis]|uniref:Proline synthase co-transcribed bacterial-like protein n=1 Tax=Pyrus ussuriensis x Pyrus communis TaxID=2448454 RepID=A0A5N5FX83_9ROSA|nr:proline synthase co-transcribed bacterial-like protein [Pyrus ussuriensis x Pyrus communis]